MERVDINNIPPEKQKLVDEYLNRVGGGYEANGFFEIECRSCGMPAITKEEVCPFCGSTDVMVTYRYS
ncbi:MAG: hypothetical protein Q4E65_02680 [Clostridia bacterium]|nr:hypothetical protein [Clostridia bacterium]